MLISLRLPADPFQKAFYSGIVAVGLHGHTKNEMLVFFDNGCDAMVAARTVCILAEQQYATIGDGRMVIDRRRNYLLMPKRRQLFVKHYLNRYPDWPLVPMKRKENTQRVNITRNGIPYSAFVLQTERQFALLRFPPKKRAPGVECVQVGCTRHEHVDEWIYRGSDRLDTIRQTIEIRERAERQERQKSVLQGLKNTSQSRREARLMHNNFEYNAISLNKIPAPSQEKEILPCSIRPEKIGIFNGQISSSRSVPNLGHLRNEPVSVGVDQLPDDGEEMVFARRQTARKSSASHLPIEDVTGGGGFLRHSTSFSDTTASLHRPKDQNLIWHQINISSKLRRDPNHKRCSMACLQEYETDPNSLTFRGSCSPYMIPLMSGWMRRSENRLVKQRSNRNTAVITYETPCGIPMLNMSQIADYLKATCSRLTVDLFTFDAQVRPTVFYKTPREAKLLDDLSQGYEAVPIVVSNEVDNERPPQIEYDPRRFPYNKDTDVSTICKEFCSSCSCTDDCADEDSCECRQLTKTEISRLARSLRPSTVRGYNYRTLTPCDSDEVILSGIYECNDSCGCDKSKCLNRVVQLGIRLPLELFKTPKIGWGVRTLVDIPAGTFVCIYAGAILTDSQAEDCGKRYGDEYFADVDLVDVVENEKQNAGVDISDYFSEEEENDDEGSRSDDDCAMVPNRSGNVSEDDGFSRGQGSDASDNETGYGLTGTMRPKNLTKRTRIKVDQSSKNTAEASPDSSNSAGDHTLQADLAFANTSLLIEDPEDSNSLPSKSNDEETTDGGTSSSTGRFNMVNYVESYKRPSLYTIDAKRKGNIGRFFNHCCEPNMRPYHVYVDTHDFRLPWIAFFTIEYVSAGSELCWDYGYTEGTVAGKKMRCLCGSKNCRKRLL